jgi:hypothetical protein
VNLETPPKTGPEPAQVVDSSQFPRQHIYTFAHRVLAQDAHREPGLWSVITGDRAYGYLKTRWADSGGGFEPMDGMLWVEPIHVAGLEICLLRMPEPQAPTEPYFVAFVRSVRGRSLRYFVLERSSTDGAFWAEWRADGMRIRGADVAVYPPQVAARVALPYPYAASFVDAIVAEAGIAHSVSQHATSTGSTQWQKVQRALEIAIVAALLVVIVKSFAFPWTSDIATASSASASSSSSSSSSSSPIERDAQPSPSPPAATAPRTRSEPSAAVREPTASKRTASGKRAATAKPAVRASVIRRVMAKRSSRIRYCYEKALLASPDLAGTVTATFTIEASGKTSSISTSGLPEVGACIKSVLERTSFPNRAKRAQTVEYPFVLRPS